MNETYLALYFLFGFLTILFRQGLIRNKIKIDDLFISAIISGFWPLLFLILFIVNYGDTVIWKKNK